MMFKSIELQSVVQQPRFVKAVLVLLGIVLAISVLQLLATGIMPVKKAAGQKEPAPITLPETFVPSPLFGGAPISGILQQTRLNLTLKGTFAAADPTLGSVIISAPDSPDHIYVVGDTVPGGAVIKEIEADYIVLEFEGNREILRLPEGKRLAK